LPNAASFEYNPPLPENLTAYMPALGVRYTVDSLLLSRVRSFINNELLACIYLL